GTVTQKQEIIPAKGHSLGAWTQTKAPTCTEKGEERRVCENCSYFETREVSAKGHNYTSVVTAPTCTERGFTTHTCQSCGDSYTDTYINAKGHTEVTDKGKAPTCTESGLTDGKHCSVCSEVLQKQEVIPAKGHSLGAWTQTKAPTCTEKGEERRVCENCSYFETRDVSAKGHNYTSAVTAPTCTERGYTTYTCQSCGDFYRDHYVDMTEHFWDDGTITKEPTETETGIRTYICQDCGETKTESIPVKDHTHKFKASVTEPTCTERGYTAYSCPSCGYSYVSDYTEPKGHTEVLDKGKSPTCTESGLTDGKHCSVCSEILEQQEMIPAAGHDWGEGTVTKEPTETETGIRTYTCKTCGETQTEEIPVSGHTHRYEISVTEPTCTEKGFTTHTCTVCGNSYTDSYTEAKGHTEITDEGKVPTCTESGLTDGKHCSDCLEILQKQEVIPAKGHSFGDWTQTKAPTCTEKGEERRTCADCSHFETREISAKGHNYTSVVTAPTCTEKGFTTHTCTVCGDSYTDSDTEPKGHDFNAWKPLSEDMHERTCACGEKETADCIWDKGVLTVEPTYETEGMRTYTCTVCGQTRTESVDRYDRTEEITSPDTQIKIEVEGDSNAVLNNSMILQTEEKKESEISEQVKENIAEEIGKKAQILASYEITLLLEDKKVQPGGKVAVTLPPPENIGDFAVIQVVFVDDNGKITPCETRVNQDGTVTFITDHFSYYAIIGSPETSANTVMIALFSVLLTIPLAGGLTAFFIIRKKKATAPEEEASESETENA
ncbi:MAG: hypothetical protein IJA86_05325, partial [Clostridia bacterium]|nr:hypothetical protein [Clostridia bacterium]